MPKIEGLEIAGATLLSIEDAEALPLRLREYNYWWWLRSPGDDSYSTASVYCDGSINYCGASCDYCGDAVRPALKIKNLESSNFEIGNIFIFGGKKFEIISKNLAFCLEDIGRHCFQKDCWLTDANDYEESTVKKYIDEWFEKACQN